MTQIDEKQEAIAKIRMAIDNDATARELEAKINSTDFKEDCASELSPNLGKSAWAAPDNVSGHSPHWIFGSPENPINSHILETEMSCSRWCIVQGIWWEVKGFSFPMSSTRSDPIWRPNSGDYQYAYSVTTTYQLFLNHRSDYINVFMSSTNR